MTLAWASFFWSMCEGKPWGSDARQMAQAHAGHAEFA